MVRGAACHFDFQLISSFRKAADSMMASKAARACHGGLRVPVPGERRLGALREPPCVQPLAGESAAHIVAAPLGCRSGSARESHRGDEVLPAWLKHNAQARGIWQLPSRWLVVPSRPAGTRRRSRSETRRSTLEENLLYPRSHLRSHPCGALPVAASRGTDEGRRVTRVVP